MHRLVSDGTGVAGISRLDRRGDGSAIDRDRTVSDRHLCVATHVARGGVLQELRLPRTEDLRGGQHGGDRPVSAHRDVVLCDLRGEMLRIEGDDLLNGFRVLPLRERGGRDARGGDLKVLRADVREIRGRDQEDVFPPDGLGDEIPDLRCASVPEYTYPAWGTTRPTSRRGPARTSAGRPGPSGWV